LADAPEYVVFTGRDRNVLRDGGVVPREENIQEQVVDHAIRWGELIENGTTVIVLADAPNPPFDVAECVSENRANLLSCAFPPDFAPSALAVAAEQVPGVLTIDLNPYICSDSECPVVIGGVLVYRDSAHLTDTFIRTMTPIVKAELAALGL
jgi:hypothetical protein